MMTDQLSATRVPWFREAATWRFIGWRIIPVFASLSLVWEAGQLRLYTIWREASAGKLVFAIAHCTAGDVAIGVSTLFLALIVVRAGPPQTWPRTRVVALATVISVGYTVFSEWMNTSLLGNWAYSSRMPVVPIVNTGLSPLLQWLVIMPVTFALSLRGLRRNDVDNRKGDRP